MLHISTDEVVESTTPVLEISTICKSAVKQCIDFNRYIKLKKLYRNTAYVLNFINKLKASSSKVTGPLIAKELSQSQKLWITATQQEVFPNEHVYGGLGVQVVTRNRVSLMMVVWGRN